MAIDRESAEPLLPQLCMHDRYGPFMRAFFTRYFDSISFPPQVVERLLLLSSRATLVYVAPSANLLHFLYLNHVCNQRGLPRAAYVNGINPVLLQPVDELLRGLHQLGQPGIGKFESEPLVRARVCLSRTVGEGKPALLFLDSPVTIARPGGGKPLYDLLEALVAVRRDSQRPMILVPHLIMWNIYPARERPALTDALFGYHHAPGLMRAIYLLLRHHRQAFVKVAEPFELGEWLEGQGKLSATEAAVRLLARLQSDFAREIFDVTGPRIRPPEQLKSEVAEDEKVRQTIEHLSGGDRAAAEALSQRAYDLVDEIAAEPRIRWPLMLDRTLQLFWRRMYEGVVVDEKGFERIRQALRQAPVVFCPSHKSHVDYLIFSQLCVYHKLPLPHIAAGINLSFWPMGPIFRHSGAFFLRRSFKGDALYPVVFRTYLRHVMAEGFPIEFFIEGTRSRTGKLLNPRFGIVSWLVEAFLDGTGEDVQFFPISIDYEKIVESRSYVKELTGGEKEKEDVGAIIKSSSHLRSKYGKIYVQVGEPISIRELMEARGLRRREISEEQRRQLVQELAYSILYRINQVHTVTPSAILAFVLLNLRRRGIGEAELKQRLEWTLKWIRKTGHERFSGTLEDFPRAVGEAAARFARDGLLSIRHTREESVYSVMERRRLELDYYRNNIVHHFVPSSIFVVALESFSLKAVPYASLSQRIGELSRMFKFEFLFRSERDFAAVVRRALDMLKEEGVVGEEGDFVVKTEEGADLREIFRATLEHFLEAYWLVSLGLGRLQEKPLSEKEFIAQTLADGEERFVKGELLLPESLNRELFKNALLFFADSGVVKDEGGTDRQGPRWALCEPYRSPEKLDQVAESVRRFLPARHA